MIESVWKNLTGLQNAKSWSQLNTSGVTLHADREPKTHHQTPTTYTYGYSHFIHFKTVAAEVGIQFLSTLIMFPQFESAFFSSKEGGVSVLLSIWWMYKSLVFGDEFSAQGLHVKSHQRCSAGIRTWLSADQSSSSTLTESSFIFDSCLIHRDTVMLE